MGGRGIKAIFRRGNRVPLIFRIYPYSREGATGECGPGHKGPAQEGGPAKACPMGETMENIIEVKGLTRTFGEVTAVNNISLSVQKGELFGLLGPNGSGKTTMIKCLTGQLKPTSGEIRVMGVDAVAQPVRVRELVGITPSRRPRPPFSPRRSTSISWGISAG